MRGIPGVAYEPAEHETIPAVGVGIMGIRNERQELEEDGSPGRARTADLVINSHPLYRLSYRGINKVLCSVFQVLCSGFYVRCSMFYVQGSWFGVRSPKTKCGGINREP